MKRSSSFSLLFEPPPDDCIRSPWGCVNILQYTTFKMYCLFLNPDFILPWPVWRLVFSFSRARYHLPTYKSLAGTCRLFRRLLKSISRPKPVLHLNPWVSKYLGIGELNNTSQVSFQQLKDAAGPYSGLALTGNDDIMYGCVPAEKTVLTLRHEAFGCFTLLDIHYVVNSDHCKFAGY